MYAFLQNKSTAFNLAAVAALILAMFAPLLSVRPVEAAQVTSRSIEMATSQAGATDSYQISFTVPELTGGAATQNIGGVRIEFCDNGPIANTQCDFDGTGDDIPDLDAATLSGSPTFDSQAISLVAPTAGDHFLTLPLASTTDPAADTVFDVTIDNIVNPDNSTDGTNVDNNTFFARIYVYETVPSATLPFTPTAATGATFATTDQVHDGGIAMGTAEQITLNARVQEKLNFCVSEIDPGADCSGLGAHTGIVDLGVLDIAVPNTAVAYAQLSTNAVNGTVIEYFAEDEFKVSGATCGETDIAATASSVDQCLNWDDTVNAMASSTEEWGTAVTAIAQTGATTSLEADAPYDFLGANQYVTEDPAYGDANNPTPGGAYDIATATIGEVVDNEELTIGYGAIAAPTTPTGFYEVTLTYIATPTF